MGIFPHTCPHCGTEKAAFATIGAKLKPSPHPGVMGTYPGSVGAVCPNCNAPIGMIVVNQNHNNHGGVAQLLARFVGEAHGPEAYGLRVTDVWPKPQAPAVPSHLPENIERAMLQAERNYRVEGNEEASAMMYRRSLELALKDKFPSLTGTLAARIKQLVADKTLPEAMGDWADEIRDLGNDAAHEPAAVDRPQLTMIRGFSDATLRYLYTLPAEIDARRKLS